MSEAQIVELSKRGDYRYIRDNFAQAGQRSFDTPPAEDQDMFHVLENVMPPVQGGLVRRWGAVPFSAFTAQRLMSYQNDTNQARYLLTLASNSIKAISEDGATQYSAVYTPTGTVCPRCVLSRDYLYVTTDAAADLKKWNGAAVSGTSKWGIVAPASAPTLGQAAVNSSSVRPTVYKNGWAANECPGYYEAGVDQGREWGLNDDVTYAYTNPTYAVDGSEATKASSTQQHTHKYSGCIWKFAWEGNPVISLKLRILSQVPANGTDGLLVTARSASIWYSVDAGVSWSKVYDSSTRAKQWDTVDLPASTDPNDVQVMAFVDSHDDMCHYVFDINMAVTSGTLAEGGLTLPLGGRRYFTVFKNNNTGHFSDLSPMSAITGTLVAQEQPLSAIPSSADTQVTHVTLLATADGGDPTTLYWVADLANGTTTYTDSTPEDVLLSSNVFLETDDLGIEHGVADNTPPVNGTLPIKHRGRLYMAYKSQYLRFSKSLNEVTTSTGMICGKYEECWPADFEMDVSEGAESIRGLFSDGQTLYIGTERQIRKLYGDGPENFQKPEVAFNEVGLANQDVCKVVFAEGAPAGVMWLTPDCKIIASDFNTYVDAGSPIQDVLNTINKSAIATANASYYNRSGYAFYALAIPTGANTAPDTVCIFNLATKRWIVWKFPVSIQAMLFNLPVTAGVVGSPQLLLVTSSNVMLVLDPTAKQDNIASVNYPITVTAQTAWLHLGDPTARKMLNELEVVTGDSGLLVSIEAASNTSEFESPVAVVTNVPITAGPFGDFKVYLASQTTKDRYYRIKFTSTSTTTTDVLGTFNLLVVKRYTL